MFRTAIMGILLSLASSAYAAKLPGGGQAFLAKHCAECHDSNAKEGGLDLTALDWKPDDPRNFDQWIKVFDKVDRQEMPPPKEKRPNPAARDEFLRIVHDELRSANLARQRSVGRVVLRRLNRVEYENTLHDLLAIDLPLQHYLPEDATTQGFDNVSEGLRLSTLHMAQYLEAADAAIESALDLRQRPEGVRKRFRYQDEESVVDDQKKTKGEPKTFRVLPDAVVIFDDNSPTTLRQFIFHERGRYRIRVSASAFQSAGRPVWLKLYATDFKTQRLLGYFDLRGEGKREMELFAKIESGELLDIKPFDTNYDEKGRGLWSIDANEYRGRGIAVECVEIEGPLVESWPPPSVARLFGNLSVKRATQAESNRGATGFMVTPDDSRAATAQVLQDFAARAFRRPVTAAEVERYVKLARKELDEGLSFDAAMRVAFRAVLASPRFLFLEEHPGQLDDWALASRLSYFLWCTQPDEELRTLAAAGALRKPEVLRGQVERMLDSPKAQAFVENFVGQWLDLRQIDFTVPDKKLYPEFDDILKASMLGETHAFFTEMLRKDLKLSNFIQSDFLMLNRCIAEHYHIAGVVGEDFRRVPLPVDCHRGGVLTQASVLKVTANGTVTSPVLRGAWVMRHLIGEPPPPPPAGVPTFEPDTRGVTTIRDQLAKHRSQTVCASCHARIDPPGFALENFDVIGGWREHYRTEKGIDPHVRFRGRDIWEYKLGPPVDASGVLADGREFKNVDEFKQLLLGREDQVASNLTKNLLTYATGAGIEFADRDVVERISARVKAQGGGLRTLIHQIVESQTFQTK